MRELEDGINQIKRCNLNEEFPSNIVNSLKDIIMKGAPSTIIEVIRQQVNELTQVIGTERFTTDDLRNMMTDLQERFNTSLQRSGGSSLLPSSDPSLQTSDRQMNQNRSTKTDVSSREREIVRKGIERLEKQILQYINVDISKDQINISIDQKV